MSPIHDRMRFWQKVLLAQDNPLHDKPRNPADVRDWHSRCFPPFVQEQVEVLLSEVNQDDPDVDYVARDPKFREHARKVSDAVNYYMDLDGLSRKMPRAHRWTAWFGFAPVKSMHKLVTECMYDEDGDVVKDEDGEPLERVVYNGPTLIPWDPFKVFPQPGPRSIEDMAWYIFESERTIEELEAAGIYDEDGLAELRSFEGGGDTQETQRQGETTEAYRARKEGVHTIHECHTRHGLFTMANRTTALRRLDYPLNEHGELPVEHIVFLEDPDSPFGVSIIALVASIQTAIHELLNLYMDAVKLKVNPPKQIDEEEDIHSAAYDVYPGANIPGAPGRQTFGVIETIASIDTFQIGQMISELRAMMERITGMNSAVAGVADDRTATQSAINLRQGKGRVGSILETADERWARLFYLSLKVLQEHLDEPVVALVAGGREVTFTPEDLQYDFMLRAKSASDRAVKDLRRQEFTTLLETLMPLIPPEEGPKIDAVALLKQYIETFGIEGDFVAERPPMPMMPPPMPPGAPVPPDPAGAPAPPVGALPALPQVGGAPSPGGFMPPVPGAAA